MSCEREPEQAWRVNVEAVRELARRGPRLVHVSTNYVFDGRRARAIRRGRPAGAPVDLRADEARRASTPRWPMANTPRGAHRRAVRAARERQQGRQLRPADDRPRHASRARCGWSPTSACSRPSPRTSPRAMLEAVEAGRRRASSISPRRARARGTSSRCDHGARRTSTSRRADPTTIAARRRSTVRSTACLRGPRADALGLRPLRGVATRRWRTTCERASARRPWPTNR